MSAYKVSLMATVMLAGAVLTQGARSVPGLAVAPAHVVSSWTVAARDRCYKLCLYTPDCVSVNWRWKTTPAVCDLNKVTETDFPEAVTPDDEAVYIELSAEEQSGRLRMCQPSEMHVPVRGHQGYLCLRLGLITEDTTTEGGSVPTTARGEGTVPPSVPTTTRGEEGTVPPSVPTTTRGEGTVPPSVPTTTRGEEGTVPPSVPTTTRGEGTVPPSVPTTTRVEEGTVPPSVPTTTREEGTVSSSVPTTTREEERTTGQPCSSGFKAYNKTILRHNRQTMKTVTVDQCLVQCLLETEYVCRSLDLRPRGGVFVCRLSDVTNDWQTTKDNVTYYERICPL